MELLERQIAATRETWNRLVQHGVGENSQLSLDFFYDAPTYQAALELKAFLERETDYNVIVASDEDEWSVRGTTQATPVSLKVLEQWVDWMIAAGLKYRAFFDGWGAEIS